jgi:predicted transcriptional regulator
MACQLKSVPETAEQVGQRLGRNSETVSELLYRMSKKGLILRLKFNGV